MTVNGKMPVFPSQRPGVHMDGLDSQVVWVVEPCIGSTVTFPSDFPVSYFSPELSVTEWCLKWEHIGGSDSGHLQLLSPLFLRMDSTHR